MCKTSWVFESRIFPFCRQNGMQKNKNTPLFPRPATPNILHCTRSINPARIVGFDVEDLCSCHPCPHTLDVDVSIMRRGSGRIYVACIFSSRHIIYGPGRSRVINDGAHKFDIVEFFERCFIFCMEIMRAVVGKFLWWWNIIDVLVCGFVSNIY